MTTTFVPASQKQIDFLTDLLATRVCEPADRDSWFSKIYEGELDKSTASTAISALVNAPRKTDDPAPKSKMQALLASIPKSKYAVPVAELMYSEVEDDFKGDLVFLELKEFNGTLYVRRLDGAPGDFTRSRMTLPQVTELMNLIKQDPHKYAKIFGEHYTCCGSCGSPLTDARSRELMLGPECRKKFGF
jgi:hypothetical protein